MKKNHDFKILTENEVIKVPNCSFFNENRVIQNYYFCQCSPTEFFPICEACTIKCHKHHSPNLKIEGIYDCQCGKCNHEITEEDEHRFISKKSQLKTNCVFSSFTDFTINMGYKKLSTNLLQKHEIKSKSLATSNKLEVKSNFDLYNNKNNAHYDNNDNNSQIELVGINDENKKSIFDKEFINVCNICSNTCLKSEFLKQKIDLKNEKDMNDGNVICECPKHYEFSHVNNNLDIIDKFSTLEESIFPFTPDILFKCDLLNEKYIQYFNTVLKQAKSKRNNNFSEIFDEIFTKLPLLKTLELIDFLNEKSSKYTNNSFLFEDIQFEYLLKINSYETSNINSSEIINFVKARTFYSGILFDFFIKNKVTLVLPSSSINSFLNMNIFQRYLIFYKNYEGLKNYNKSIKIEHDEKFIYKNNTKSDIKTIYIPYSKDIIQYAYGLLDLYDFFMKINEKENINELIFSIVFPKLNKIFKYLIKYNLLTYNVIQRYFDTVLESISLAHDTYLKIKEVEEEEDENEGFKHETNDYDDENNNDPINQKNTEKIKETPSILYNTEEKIIKSIFYYLVHRNDEILIDRIKNNTKNPQYVFISSKDTKNICKTFICILIYFQRSKSLKNTLKFDLYFEKIMELLINNNKFYLTGIENLKFLGINEFKLFSENNLEKSVLKIIGNEVCHIFLCKNSILLYENNKDIKSYSISYSNWISNLKSVINNIRQFIDKEIGTNHFANNFEHYQLVIQENFVTDNEYKKIQSLQNSYKYSNILNYLNETFELYNYCIDFKTSGKVDIEILLDEEIKTIIEFLTILIFKNKENLVYLFNMNFKNLKNIMMKHIGAEFYNFLNYIIDVIFFKTDYKFDNINTIVEILNDIYISLPSAEDKVLQNLYVLDKIAFILSKGLQSISISNLELISIIESYLDKISSLKSDETFIKSLKEILNSNKLEEIEKSNFKHISSELNVHEIVEIIFNFLTSYFNLINELQSNDFKFLNILSNSKHLLFPLNYLEELINNKVTLTFQLKIEVLRYVIHAKLDKNLSFQNTAQQLNCIFLSNIPQNLCSSNINFNLNYLTLDSSEEHISKSLDSQTENLFISLDNIEEILKSSNILNIDDFILIKTEKSNVLNYNNTNKSTKEFVLSRNFTKLENVKTVKSDKDTNDFLDLYLIKKTICFLKYYEFCVLRPSFFAFNMYLLNYQQIKGQTFHKLYSLAYRFLKVTIYLYENVLNSSEYKKLRKNLDSSTTFFNEILSFEEVSVVSFINENSLNKLNDFANLFTDDKVKYFQVNIIQNIMNECIKIIFKEYPNIDLSISNNNIKEEDKSKINFNSLQISSLPNNIFNDNFYVSKKVIELVEEYNEIHSNTIDEELGLISIFSSNDNEVDVEMHKILFDYLLSKLSDKLTLHTFNLFSKNTSLYSSSKLMYQPGLISNFNAQDFKFQNSSVIISINNLFLHCSEVFQELLEERLSENDQSNLIFTISKNFVFSNILQETLKHIELKHIYPQASLSLDIGIKFLKFLQNMCEGHNINFQNKFFNMCLNNETNKFNFNTFYPEFEDNSKNIKRKTLLRKTVKSGDNKIVSFDIKKSENASHQNNPSNISNELSHLKDEDKKIQSKFQSNYELKDLNSKKISFDDNINENIIDNNIQNVMIIDENVDSNDMFIQKELHKIQIETSNLLSKQKTLLNFFVNCQRIIYLNSIYSNICLYRSKELIKNDEIKELYQGLTDLIVEMIQGTRKENFENFYKKLPEKLEIIDESGNINMNSELSFKGYCFAKLIIEIRSQLTTNPNEVFCFETRDVKYNLFFTLNNIINQDLPNFNIIKLFYKLLDPSKIINVISVILRGVYVKYVLQVNYDDQYFLTNLDQLEFNEEDLQILNEKFETESELYEDQFFSLACQMFLFIKIIGAKYKVSDVLKILNYEYKEVINADEGIEKTEKKKVNQDFNETSELHNNSKSKIFENFTNVLNFINKSDVLRGKSKKKNSSNKNPINNLIISVKFLSGITKGVEFQVNTANNENGELNLKIIFFTIDPRSYLLSKTSIDRFLDEVDRSSSATKLKSLIENLNNFIAEIEYKLKIGKSKILKKMLEVDYSLGDKLNFIFALLINFILLISLKNGYENIFTFIIVTFLAIIQSVMNVLFVIFFLCSKYSFNVMIEQSNIDIEKIEIMNSGKYLMNILNVYLFNSFIFNEDIYVMLLNLIIAIIASLSQYSTFLFSLQLLSIIKFVPAVKEIFIAFKIRFGQLISMIIFLFIILFCYASIGFNFYFEEFEIKNDEMTTNLCQNLYQCTITFFNLGVRSGGGIGDVLGNENNNTRFTFWVRYVSDMVFFISVILLLLNMVNGIIVSTFSQLREENNKKEDDINNKCFLCSIDRLEFEKRKISFKDHVENEHSIYTYIKYLIWIKMLNIKDLDGDQSFIRNCIKENEVSCFPIKKCSTIGDLSKEKEENDEE